MEILLALVVVGVVLFILVWRPPRGRRRTPEEVLEDELLRKEQDRLHTEAMYREDLYNIPPRGRR